jgi:hypothetical protein
LQIQATEKPYEEVFFPMTLDEDDKKLLTGEWGNDPKAYYKWQASSIVLALKEQELSI